MDNKTVWCEKFTIFCLIPKDCRLNTSCPQQNTHESSNHADKPPVEFKNASKGFGRTAIINLIYNIAKNKSS